MQSKMELYILKFSLILRFENQHLDDFHLFLSFFLSFFLLNPQTHTSRGIPFGVVIGGITKALKQAKEEKGFSSMLIMSFLRHLSEEVCYFSSIFQNYNLHQSILKEAFKTLEESLPYKNLIQGIGLDSMESGNPPSKFQRVFVKYIPIHISLIVLQTI